MAEMFTTGSAGRANTVIVSGLQETTRAIKLMEDTAPKMMRDAMKRVALIIVGKVQSQVPAKKGRARRSVKPRGGVNGVGIAVGGPSAPYYPWLDFGGTTGKGHRPGVAYSGSIERTYLGRPYGDGRFLYPTIMDNIEEVQDAFVSELNGLLTTYGMKATD